MPLPEPSEQEGESVKAGQEPSPEPPEPGTDVVLEAPTKPMEFSELVLLAASTESGDGMDTQPEEVHCVLTLEMADPDTLAGTPQILPVEEQCGVVQPRPQTQALKPSKPNIVTQPLEFLRTPFGGRLLVLESFLYKQEKAVGDKVYWKCREHTELGCRGRAITRGPRATIMRGHCHPPDEEGLAARRQRQKRLGPALPEGLAGSQGPSSLVEEPLEGAGPWLCPVEPDPTPGPMLSYLVPEEDEGLRALALLRLPPKKRSTLGSRGPPPLEFLRTCYGGSFLVHQSFLYKREKAVGDKVYWTCRDHTQHGCRSRAITQGRRVTVMRGHCHAPDLEGLKARRQQERAMAALRAQPGGPGGPEDKPLQGVDSLLYRRGPGPLTLTRPRPRKRLMANDEELPAEPQGEEDKDEDPGGPEFLRTPLGGSFLVYESFLYRREKAAGEKVYWTCRDQARMGCRSRAITQGRRVTVMRGHCHPPDLGGLEALRQREKRPGTAQRGSTGGPEFLRTPLGGSFLVYESFLYRREKAAGEKVYWTCRDQARMGCRSRAITQGPRVMVMRRHCHPPDLGGLEALRQREQLPSPAQREGSGAPLTWHVPSRNPQPLEFLRTSLGGRFLVYESFLYRKEKAAGEKVYWMCRDQARKGCRSRAITQGPRVTVMRGHCHPPDLAGLEALRRREQLPSLAQQEDPEKVKLLPEVQLCLETCAPECQQSYGKVESTQLDNESQ